MSIRFFVLYLSLVKSIGWFIDVFRCNHPSLTMVKTFIFRKSEANQLVTHSPTYFRNRGPVPSFFQNLFLAYSVQYQNMHLSEFYKIYSGHFVIGQAIEKICS
jgi:hypothetical protein